MGVPTVVKQRQRIGIVGIGKIGLPIAQNLIASGFEVHGYRRSDMTAFTDAGGAAQPDCAGAASVSDVLITCLPDEDSLNDVVCSIAEVARPGQILLEMSTLSLGCKLALFDRLESVGVDMLDCPVLGLPPMVADRRGVVFVGGRLDTYESVTGVLDGFTDTHRRVGEFGAGTKFKFVANTLIASNTVAAAEALALAHAAELDMDTLFDMLVPSAAASTMLAVKGPRMVAGDFLSAGGTVDLLAKDARTIDAFATELGVVLPALRHSLDVLDDAARDGRGDHDTSTIYDLIQRSPAVPPAHQQSETS